MVIQAVWRVKRKTVRPQAERNCKRLPEEVALSMGRMERNGLKREYVDGIFYRTWFLMGSERGVYFNIQVSQKVRKHNLRECFRVRKGNIF